MQRRRKPEGSDGDGYPSDSQRIYNYLQEQEVGRSYQLRHAKQGIMVNIAVSQIVVTVVLQKKQKKLV